MSRKCDLSGKLVLTGNNVSHANNKTKRRFLPNLQIASLYSEKLNKKIRFKVAASTLRTVEKNGGIDNFLIDARNQNLSSSARKHKKSIEKIINTENSKKVL